MCFYGSIHVFAFMHMNISPKCEGRIWRGSCPTRRRHMGVARAGRALPLVPRGTNNMIGLLTSARVPCGTLADAQLFVSQKCMTKFLSYKNDRIAYSKIIPALREYHSKYSAHSKSTLYSRVFHVVGGVRMGARAGACHCS